MVLSHLMERLVSIAEPQHLSPPPPLPSRHPPRQQMIQSSTNSAQDVCRLMKSGKGLGESTSMTFLVTGRRRCRATARRALALEEPRRIAFPSHFCSHLRWPPVSLGRVLRGPANQKRTVLLLCRHAVCTRTCSAPSRPPEKCPGDTPWRNREDASAIQVQDPNAFPELLPGFHSAISELPTIFTPSPAAQHNFPVQRNQSHLSC